MAALLGYGATAHLSPAAQVTAAVLGGLIALAAHGGKTAVRAAAAPSPEPVSNIALSLGEDALAVILVVFAAKYPWIAAGIVLMLLVATLVILRWVWRALAALFRGARRQLREVH